MSALRPTVEPPLLTADREERANLHVGDAVYRATCGCGLPSLVARPCGGKRVGEWTAGCAYCETRLFSPRRSAFYARFAHGDQLAAVDIERRARTIATVRASGRETLARVKFIKVRLGGREKSVSPTSVGCLACGEPTTATIRQDRYGRLYLSCSACAVITFTYTPASSEFNIGVAASIAMGAIEWSALHREGEAVWSRLATAAEFVASPSTAPIPKDLAHAATPIHR